LVVVAAIALYAYERIAREVVRQRDTELARISAARLSDSLSRYSRILQATAADEEILSLEPARISAALREAQNQLYVFDAGVAVYNSEGAAVWSQPYEAEKQGVGFPVPSEFTQVRRTLRPAFSNVVKDPISSEDVILVVAPIVERGGEFRGVLAGMIGSEKHLLGTIYREVLELKAGSSGYAYLVDGNGRVIYHPDGALIGGNLMATEPVMRATRGETGAVLCEDAAGETVISGFAPVPGTDWGLITQERWASIVGPIRNYSKLLLGLLAAGGVVSGALVFFAIGRVLKPVKDLTQGAQQIAGGDFDRTIVAKTGDEVQALAQQFNTMAAALKESYTELERRIAERTRELRESEERLRTVVTAAPIVLFALDSKGDFTLLEGKGLEALGLKPSQVVGRSAFDVYRDVPQVVENIRRSLAGEEFASTVEVGESTFETRYSPLRDENGQVIGLIGVATDVADRKQAEEAMRDLAVIEERNRMAREIHDTLAQGFTGIVLQLEAAEQALEERPAEVPEHLGRAKNLARESLQEARRSVWDLLPRALEQRPLEAALHEHVRLFAAAGREKASFSLSGDRRDLPSNVQAALLRICQESLTNIRRHARATVVRVDLTFYPEAVCLRIEDNGTGFDFEAVKTLGSESGFGLAGMEERARLIGGTLAVRSREGEGTSLEVQIPTA